MEWYADEVDVSPMALFNALNRIGKTPFSAFLSFDNTYLMSASPERFLQRRGRHQIRIVKRKKGRKGCLADAI